MTDHANRGVGWERVLELQHDRYRREGLAVVLRTPPPVKVLGRVVDGKFRAAWAAEGPPDYAGLVRPVIPIAFDAKDCESSRWSFGALERHQARDLEAWSKMGGYAFVALRMADDGWVLPWTELGPRWWAWHEREGRAASGTAGLDVDGCAAIGLRMPAPGDWLGAFRAGGIA